MATAAETYTQLGPNCVESSASYRVRGAARTCVLYSEADREVAVEVEPGDGLAVYAQTIVAWRPPNEASPLSEGDRKRIMVRVVDALRYMGVSAIPS